jgi:hypothetical protein
MSETVRTVTYSDIWVDDFNNIRQSTEFELVLGRISEEYRFIPQGITLEQGLTPEMLDIISSLIRKKAGIGEQKAEPITEEEGDK